MTWTAMTDYTIPAQPGLKTYNMKASGTIYMGQGVAISPNMDSYVYVPQASSQHVFGVAAYDAVHGSSLAVWGLLNMVNATISSATDAGVLVGVNREGTFSNRVKYKDAVCLDTTSAAGEVGRVLLVGPIV